MATLISSKASAWMTPNFRFDAFKLDIELGRIGLLVTCDFCLFVGHCLVPWNRALPPISSRPWTGLTQPWQSVRQATCWRGPEPSASTPSLCPRSSNSRIIPKGRRAKPPCACGRLASIICGRGSRWSWSRLRIGSATAWFRAAVNSANSSTPSLPILAVEPGRSKRRRPNAAIWRQ